MSSAQAKPEHLTHWEPARKMLLVRREIWEYTDSAIILTTPENAKNIQFAFRVIKVGKDVDVGVPVAPGDLVMAQQVSASDIDRDGTGQKAPYSGLHTIYETMVRAVLPLAHQTGRETSEARARNKLGVSRGSSGSTAGSTAGSTTPAPPPESATDAFADGMNGG